MFHPDRLLVRQIVLIAGVIGVAMSSSLARDQGSTRSGDTDPKTGIRFPVRIGAFEREGPIEYDDAGYPMATYLAGSIALASVFYYKDAPFAVEYANARDTVKIKTPTARLLSDARSDLHPSGRRASFTFEGKFLGGSKTKLMSELLMFPHHDHYLTFRITYLANHADRARQEIDRFVRGFPLP